MLDRVQLIRRGIAFAGDCHQKVYQHVASSPEEAEKFLRHIAARFQTPSAIILLSLTVLSAVVVLSGVEYAIRFVATNLAIVEHTSSSGRVVLADEPDAPLYKAPLLEDVDGDEKLPVPEQAALLPMRPITSGLRSTIRHIHSQEGFRARFRGIRFGIFYMSVMGMLSIIFQAFFAALLGPFGFWLGTTLAAVASCNAHATWTHAMIAVPTGKSFFKSFLPTGVAKQLIMPTIRLHAQIGLMHLAVMTTGLRAARYMAASQRPTIHAVIPILGAIVIGFGAVLPSYIALVRFEASLLPEDMSAIIPFDRTFGGRMTKLAEPSRCRFAIFRNMSLRGAYMTFDRDTYKRTLKMLVKFVVVAVTFYLAFVALLAAEAYVIIGGRHNLRKLFEIADAARLGRI